MTEKLTRKKKLSPQKRGYLAWQWKNKHRTYKIPAYLAMNYTINIGTEWDTTGINSSLGPYAHMALEEIRLCLTIFDTVTTGNMNPEHIRSTNDDWSDLMKQAWSRFRLWNVLTAKEGKIRPATILFARGERPTTIEKKIKVRNGTAKNLIEKGLEKYGELILSDMKNNRE